VLALLLAVIVLITQPWAVLLCVGPAGAGLTLTQLGTPFDDSHGVPDLVRTVRVS
jgi:hypothetical protein